MKQNWLNSSFFFILLQYSTETKQEIVISKGLITSTISLPKNKQ